MLKLTKTETKFCMMNKSEFGVLSITFVGSIKFGVSASGGFNVGVAHGESSANFGVETTNKQAHEVTHKHMRQQSEKLTSEIRRNFHTTFRTVTEVNDTSSRRYVVQNTTENLVNYELREEERTVVYRRLIRQLMKVGGEEPHVTSELIRAIFDVDSMLYFVAPEWWRPKQHARQQIASAHLENRPSGEMHIPLSSPLTLTQEDKIGWGGVGAKGRDNYMITEESAPAGLGSSLGWLLQLDGDNHRNAFLNSPWVKAVIPIRQGREAAALRWLQLAQVEGVDGLDCDYEGPEPEYQNPPSSPKKKLLEVLQIMAEKLTSDAKNFDNVLETEKVFEQGFDLAYILAHLCSSFCLNPVN